MRTGWWCLLAAAMSVLVWGGVGCSSTADDGDGPPDAVGDAIGNDTTVGDRGETGPGDSAAADAGAGPVSDAGGPLPPVGLERPDGGSASARATKVVDGDSFEADVQGEAVEVRLIGLNANEGGDCFGDEAGDFLRTALEGEFELISPSADDNDPEWVDDFGRLLRYVYADGELVSYRLIFDGWAVSRAQSDHPLAEEFEQAELQARDAQRGLWAPDACGEAAAEGVLIVDFNANAPGPDDENRNGEWVELLNTVDDEISLGGWVLRDESTRHRYVFDADFALGPGASVRIFSGASNEPLSDDYAGASLFWDDPDGSVWNNGGDTILLLDPSGNIVASEPYGES